MKGIIKDAFILFAITLVSGVLLGFVYEVTKEPIAIQEAKTKAEACAAVFSDAVSFEVMETDGSLEESLTYDRGEVEEILYAVDASGERAGYVMTVTSHEGYGGDITFLIGIRNDGTINGISITEISETAGLGMKAKEEEFTSQFSGKQAGTFVYTTNGASAEHEIDAISSATITTNAMVNGVNGAMKVFGEIQALENGGVN